MKINRAINELMMKVTNNIEIIKAGRLTVEQRYFADEAIRGITKIRSELINEVKKRNSNKKKL